MAGIKKLEKKPEYLNFVIHNLLKPECRFSMFDDMVGWNDLVALLYSPGTVVYGLFEKGRPTPFGVVFFTDVNPYRSCCLWACIFNKEDRGKGKIKPLVNLIKADMVNTYKLHSVVSRVIDGNEASVKFLKSLGFKFVGKKEEYMFVNGKYVDLLEFYLVLGGE